MTRSRVRITPWFWAVMALGLVLLVVQFVIVAGGGSWPAWLPLSVLPYLAIGTFIWPARNTLRRPRLLLAAWLLTVAGVWLFYAFADHLRPGRADGGGWRVALALAFLAPVLLFALSLPELLRARRQQADAGNQVGPTPASRRPRAE